MTMDRRQFIGVGVHWTAQTVPRKGPPLPFQKAVDAFDVKRFVDQVMYAGADYLLFTSAHALQMLPAPHPVIEKILPGRTCKRDLIAEVADAHHAPMTFNVGIYQDGTMAAHSVEQLHRLRTAL